MVTYEYIKKLIYNDFKNSEDIKFLRQSKSLLKEAYHMLVNFRELNLTEESIKNGFNKIARFKSGSGVAYNVVPVNEEMRGKIIFAIDTIDKRLIKLNK